MNFVLSTICEFSTSCHKIYLRVLCSHRSICEFCAVIELFVGFVPFQLASVVELNVGGRHFTTDRATLTKYPDSMLAAMFSGRHDTSTDKDGRHFIDMDADRFTHILSFLRYDEQPPDKHMKSFLRDMDYFGLPDDSILAKTRDIKRSLLEHPVLTESEFPGILPFVLIVIELARVRHDSSIKRNKESIVYVALADRENNFNSPANVHHRCEGMRATASADVTFGPWKSPINEAAFFEILCFVLKQQGICARLCSSERCSGIYYGNENKKVCCPRKLYCLSISWPSHD
jgi:hypothetical protein